MVGNLPARRISGLPCGLSVRFDLDQAALLKTEKNISF